MKKKTAGLFAAATLVLSTMPFAAHAGSHNKEVDTGNTYAGVETGNGCEGVYVGDSNGYHAFAFNGTNPYGYREAEAGRRYHSNPVPGQPDDPDQSLCQDNGAGIFP